MNAGNDLAAALLAFRERIRRAVAAVSAPLADRLAAHGVVADHITWAGLALAAAAGLVAGFGVFVAAGIVYLLGGLADLLDGALARQSSGASRAGAFLDSTLDRAGEGLLHAGAAVAFARFGDWPAVLAVMLSLTGSYLTSYARARAEALGIELSEAWVSRGERVVLLSAGLIFHFALAAFWILAFAGWATAIQRGFLARKRLAGSEPAAPDKDSFRDDDAG